jgi:hypothetical protein
MNAKLIILASLAILAALISVPGTGEASYPINSLDLTFAEADFRDGITRNLVVTSEGLMLASRATSGQYTSPIIDTPLSFNAIVPHWLAEIPYTANMTIHLRTGTVAGEWSDWYSIYENDDWMMPGDVETIGQMIAVPAEDVTHDLIQFKVTFSRYYYAPSAVLQQLRLTLIDSTDGPTSEQMLEVISSLEGANAPGSSYPKPPVIPRSIWCTDPACNYSDGLEYEPVTHLIVHHTVSSNTSSDWAAVVRAIWYYHTFTRNWGDIGYNFLVDKNGVLYEGHLGGDDVVGTHAADANEGSMALAFIGTFTEPHQSPPGITPPAAMLDSAAELFTWKADQKGIDVFGASHLPNVDWGLPHLMGHRDVYGTTTCPGDQAHELLPWLRDEVANRMGFVSPHQYVDELSGSFSLSNTPYWYTPPGGCGFNGHAYYTWSVDDPADSTNWGEWRPSISDAGVYEVEVYAPFCITGRSETNGAMYTVTHSNGTDTVVASHEDNVGTWMSLGVYYFNAGTGGFVRLTDLSATESGLGVWFDAIRLRPLDPNLIPTISNFSPAPDTWEHNQTVKFEWDVINGTAVHTTKLMVATDPNLNNLVLSETFSGAPSSYTYTFVDDYPRLFWRVVMTTLENHTVASNITWFGIDTVAPTSQVEGVVRIGDSHYALNWSGFDETSGIESYLVEYRADGDSQWYTLLSGTNWNSAAFFPPDEQVYWFRSQALDVAGHSEPKHPNGDISTEQAVQLYRVIISPLIFG